MAKFKPSLGSLRGKVADNVFSHNTFGDYVRRRTSPVNPMTPDQDKVRGWLTDASRRYTEVLTDPTRQQWKNWAALISRVDPLGTPYHLTGITAFQLVNLNRRKVTIPWTWQDLPPPLTAPPEEIQSGTATFALGAQTVIITGTPTPIPAKRWYLFYSTPGVTYGKDYVKQLYRFIQGFGPAAPSPWDITLAWLSKFGGFAAGWDFKVRCRTLSTDSWLMSNGFDLSVVGTP